ncbi:uncharacterized protein LOC123321067 [Coccinella septempunctata]|uniref:uncharacterized protein LOC123321067 n=1 Tax=Coccinella septempunctata TaxID=41139 RepID=UPI001D092602|nr:uncharacterized protein LOC123321067 [Coccinella septempunctata]
MKVFERILDGKIREKIETNLEETQSGFRKGRSIQDHIFTLKILIERAKQKDGRIYMGFVDLVKAFDRVKRRKLWKILEERGMNKKIVRLVKNVYELNRNRIISHNRTSGEFSTKIGLRQGGS